MEAIVKPTQTIIVQPTTLCNLNCSYCYLPHRKAKHYMQIEVIQEIVKFVEDQNSPVPVSIVWHGGEPLVTGIERFKAMLEPFEHQRSEGKIQHFIQTNATLITDEWCELFIQYNIRVGVSIDGDKTANSARVNWSGLEAYDQIIAGIGKLRDWNIPFSVIAVVGKQNIEHPTELFDFFASLGCFQLGINIEEQEGINDGVVEIDSDMVRTFWRELFKLWKANPIINIREFRQFLRFASLTIDKDEERWTNAASTDTLPKGFYNIVRIHNP